MKIMIEVPEYETQQIKEALVEDGVLSERT